MADGIRLLRPGRDELPQLAELERLCFPDDAWSEALLAGSLEQRDAVALALEEDGRMTAFCLGRCLAGEAELHTISVRPGLRRGGRGRRLLRAFLADCQAQGARCVWLEVRAGNDGAILLYERAGFRGEGRRPRYYSDGEDAILMRMDLAERA